MLRSFAKGGALSGSRLRTAVYTGGCKSAIGPLRRGRDKASGGL
jgi:hypothetical protein